MPSSGKPVLCDAGSQLHCSRLRERCGVNDVHWVFAGVMLCAAMCGLAVGSGGVQAESLPVQETSQGIREEHFDVFRGAIPVRLFSFEYEDDRDYDKQPDDWVRRQGAEFRQYVSAEIDYQQACHGQRSLRMDANGSGAAYYSPPIPIDHEHMYVLQASILTRGLQRDAALVSFSFLNQRKQRVKRLLTAPVSGTHRDWQHLQIPPVSVEEDVKFVVIGCHLVPSDNRDINGSAWFDRLSISKLPKLSLASNFETHFRESNSPIAIHSRASGLDASFQEERYEYELRLRVEDVNGNVLDRTSYQLQTLPAKPQQTPSIQPVGQNPGQTLVNSASRSLQNSPAVSEASPSGMQTEEGEGVTPISGLLHEPEQTVWQLTDYPPGFYRVRAVLLRNQLAVVQKSTSFAVLNLKGKAPLRGEFGWNLAGDKHRVQLDDLLAITRESGINWLKMPVWEAAASAQASDSGQFLTALRNQAIIPIGMLSDPPLAIRRKFAPEWSGMSELFLSPPSVWRDGVNQVMALYSPTVTRWQLGDDRDSSFVGLPDFNRTTQSIRREMQRIGQIRQLGVHWNAGSAVPVDPHKSRNFLTVVLDESTPLETVAASVQQIQRAGFEAWVIVRANATDPERNSEQRANEFVKRLVAAKQTGCDLVFCDDVFSPVHGLLEQDGSPTELFLPWRTVALALNDTRYSGSIVLPGRSPNHVFLGENTASMIVWNTEPREEEIYLGDDVQLHTIWGERVSLPSDFRTGRQKFKVSGVPLILTGCSKSLMEWRMRLRFDKGQVMNSMTTQEETLFVTNTFPWPVNGTAQVIASNGWEVQPTQLPVSAQPGEETGLPLEFTIPSRTGMGEQMLGIEFNLGGTGLSYPFQVYSDYLVGTGDVHMEISLTRHALGGLIVEQSITNNTDPPEMLDLRCHLLTRGRRRQTRNMDGLMSGQTRKVIYHIADFDELPTRELWLRAEQKNGRRIFNELFNNEQIEKLLERAPQTVRQ